MMLKEIVLVANCACTHRCMELGLVAGITDTKRRSTPMGVERLCTKDYGVGVRVGVRETLMPLSVSRSPATRTPLLRNPTMEF